MKPAQGCYLFGVYKACIGIKDAVVLFHSITGCHVGTLILHMNNDLEDVRQACSVIYEQDIIHGGQKQLEAALQEIKQLYQQARLLIVISGCIPNMIGDDIESEVKKAGLEIPALHIAAAGTAGTEQEGYEAALIKLIQFIKPVQQIRSGLVNIWGLTADDPRVISDLNALKDMLGPELVLQAAGPSCMFDEFKLMAQAELNVVFGANSRLGRYLEEKFGTPYIQAEYPYGLIGMKALQKQIAGKLPRLDYSQQQMQAAAALRPELKKITHFLNSLYGVPVAIVGDSVRTVGLKRFLSEELGLNVVFDSDCAVEDLNSCYDNIRRSNVVAVFGSSFVKDLAEELNIPLIPFCYPVFDQIVLGNKPFLGTDGILNILECLINSFLQKKYKPDGAYADIFRQLEQEEQA